VDVEGIRGSVRAHSANGSANIRDVIGDVEVATANAKVSCAGTRGNLSARSSNGKIEIQHHSGSVNASTSNGLIRAALDEVDARGVQLATSNGRIVLNLPDETDADMDVRARDPRAHLRSAGPRRRAHQAANVERLDLDRVARAAATGVRAPRPVRGARARPGR
jgi:hypothetical protein